MPQPDPEDPVVKGDIGFKNKPDFMDEQFLLECLAQSQDPKYEQLLLNVEKLTKGAFNITVPLRDQDLKTQLEEVGMENNFKNREAFYELVYTTPNLGNYTSGAVLTDELIRHPD